MAKILDLQRLEAAVEAEAQKGWSTISNCCGTPN